MGLRGPLHSDEAIQLNPQNADRPVPRPPDDLHPQLLIEWNEYWTSDVAMAADVVDIPMISRLFAYRDEWLRSKIAYNLLDDDERTVEGTNRASAIRIHPYAQRMTKLEGEIQKLEDRLGLSPLSRARLGIEIGQQKLTWQQLAKTAQPGVGAGEQQSALPVAGVKE